MTEAWPIGGLCFAGRSDTNPLGALIAAASQRVNAADRTPRHAA